MGADPNDTGGDGYGGGYDGGYGGGYGGYGHNHGGYGGYGGCYIVRQPMYDDWGNYLGRRRVQVCD